MVLALHQLQSLVGKLVVELHGFLVRDVDSVGKSLVELDEAYDAVVDQCDKLRTNAFAHFRFMLDLERADALGFNEELIG